MSFSHLGFEETDCFSDDYPVPALRVHARSACGAIIRNVAAILEPESANPCLLLRTPLGLNAARTLLDDFAEQRKRKHG